MFGYLNFIFLSLFAFSANALFTNPQIDYVHYAHIAMEYSNVGQINIHHGGHNFSLTGTLIAPNIVITCAHGLDDLARPGVLTDINGTIDFAARVNERDISKRYHIRSVLIHPQRDADGNLNDVSLLVLNNNVEGIAPAKIVLHFPSFEAINSEFFGREIVGHGVNTYGISDGIRLAAPTNDLYLSQNGLIENVFRAPDFDAGKYMNKPYAVTSSGDSGGPLFVRDSNGDSFVTGVIFGTISESREIQNKVIRDYNAEEHRGAEIFDAEGKIKLTDPYQIGFLYDHIKSVITPLFDPFTNELSQDIKNMLIAVGAEAVFNPDAVGGAGPAGPEAPVVVAPRAPAFDGRAGPAGPRVPVIAPPPAVAPPLPVNVDKPKKDEKPKAIDKPKKPGGADKPKKEEKKAKPTSKDRLKAEKAVIEARIDELKEQLKVKTKPKEQAWRNEEIAEQTARLKKIKAEIKKIDDKKKKEKEAKDKTAKDVKKETSKKKKP